jgi:hypothetical protein
LHGVTGHCGALRVGKGLPFVARNAHDEPMDKKPKKPKGMSAEQAVDEVIRKRSPERKAQIERDKKRLKKS